MYYCNQLNGGAEMADVSNDKWINIDEAAEYLGVKPELFVIGSGRAKVSLPTKSESYGSLNAPSWMPGSQVEKAQWANYFQNTRIDITETEF